MKAKKGIIIIILCVVAVAMGLLLWKLKKQETPGVNEQKENAKTILTPDVSKITRMVLKGTKYKGVFEKRGEQWQSDADILNQDVMDSICNVFLKNLKVLSEVKNPAADSEYGLDNPTSELLVYAGEELMVSIKLGAKVPTRNQYYCKINEDGKTYTVSESYAFYMDREQNYYTVKQELPNPGQVNNLREVTIEGTLFPELHAVFDSSNPYDYSNRMLLNWYFDKPINGRWEASFDSDKWLAQLAHYTSIYYDEIVSVHPKSLSEYGLDNPVQTLTVDYTNSTGVEKNRYRLLLGKQREDGAYYFKVDGYEPVMVMSEFVTKLMFDVDWFANIYPTLFFPNYTSMGAISVKIGDTEYLFENVGGTDTEPEFTLNGKAVPKQLMVDWSNVALVLKVNTYKPCDVPDTNPEVTVFITPKDSTKNKEIEIRLYPGENGKYIVYKNGTCNFTINERNVKEFVNYMQGLQ